MQRRNIELGNLFLAAPFTPQGWETALRELARQTRSAHGELIAVGDRNLVTLNLATDLGEDFNRGFVEIDGGSAETNWRVANVDAPLTIKHESHYVASRRRMDCGIYDDFVNQYDLWNGCQTVLSLAPDHFVGMAMLRTTADGVTTESDRACFAVAARAAHDALQLQRSVDDQCSVLAAGALEAANVRALLFDGFGRLRAVTAVAEELIARCEHVRIINGRLSARDEYLNNKLQRILWKALNAPAGCTTHERLWVGDRDVGHEGVHLEIMTLPHVEWNLGFAPRVLMVLHHSESIDESCIDLIADALHLTKSEAAVALMTANGVPRERIAQLRNTSSQTVNSQLKCIFRKTEINREAELVVLIRGLIQ